MYYNVMEARYISGFRIWLRFRDGLTGEIDLQHDLNGPVFEPLHDVEFFGSSRCIRSLKRSSGRMAPRWHRSSCTRTRAQRPN